MHRKRKIALSTVALVFTLVSVAAAYYLVAGLGEGEGHAKLGKSTTAAPFPVTLAFADELTPGNKEQVAVTFNNTTGRETDVKHLAITPSTSVPGCLASWFTISTDPGAAGTEAVLQGTSTGASISIPTGTSTFMADASHPVFVAFKEEAAVDQTACSEATLTLHAVATP